MFATRAMHSTTMPALWLENRVLSYRPVMPVPIPEKDHALVKVRLAGICATDLELVKGYYPFTGVPGHEFVGIVARSPDAASLVGQRVVADINIGCGHCESCRSGHTNHCPHRRVVGIKNYNGAMAPYMSLPLKNLHIVPEELTDEAAVFTEPVAAALQIREQVRLDAGQRVLVIGAGRLGQLIARTLSTSGCRLEVAARYAGQRKVLEMAGIDWVRENEVAGQRYHVVVEASGSVQGLSTALHAVCPTGTIILKSTFKGRTSALLSDLVVNEITLIGSRCGPIAKAVNLLTRGDIDPVPLIEGRYGLDDGLKAFEHAARPGCMKILIEMPEH